MRQLTLCARCGDKLAQGGLEVRWVRRPGVEKAACQECRRKTYCGQCEVCVPGRGKEREKP